MSRHFPFLRAFSFVLLLGFASSATAKQVTINDISIDVPSSFTATDYSRGIETKTNDEEVYVWFETYTGNESDALIAEHDKYWDEQKVLGGADPVKTSGKLNGGADFNKTDYVNATWKGKPTVLRYLQIGPMGADDKYVLVTLWASPEGDTARADDIGKMFNSLTVTYKK